MAKVGRKSKYTPKTVRKILKYLKEGNNQVDSAVMSGIGHDTFFKWIREKPEFAESVKYAMAFNKAERLKRISTHARVSWQADAWYLERMFPNQYALKTVTELQGRLDTNLTVNVVPFIPPTASPDELTRIREAYGDEAFNKGIEANNKARGIPQGTLEGSLMPHQDALEGTLKEIDVPLDHPTIKNTKNTDNGTFEAKQRDMDTVTPSIVSHSEEDDEEYLEAKGNEKPGL